MHAYNELDRKKRDHDQVQLAVDSLVQFRLGVSLRSVVCRLQLCDAILDDLDILDNALLAGSGLVHLSGGCFSK
jgi:hypothetical protein